MHIINTRKNNINYQTKEIKMIIKIGNKIFDSKKEPIMIIFQDGDLNKFYKLKNNEYRLFIFTGKKMNEEDIENFMILDTDGNHGA
jgi:hypothetical protein